MTKAILQNSTLFIQNGLFGWLGTKTVKKETELFIKELMHEINLKENIQIFQLSEYAIYNGIGKKSVCAIDSWLTPLLFINQDWFDTLTIQEKRFVIGHELMHLKYHHGKKKLLYFLCTLVVCRKTMKSYGCLIACQIMQSLIIQACEYEADYQAVRQLHCLKGMQLWAASMKKYLEEIEEELPQGKLFYYYRNLKKLWASIFLGAHPSIEDRLDYVLLNVA